MQQFIRENLAHAAQNAKIARQFVTHGNIRDAGRLISSAIVYIGIAQHPIADSSSPAHSGFDVWYGPEEGILELGTAGHQDFVNVHKHFETEAAYDALGDGPARIVETEFCSILIETLME